MTDHHATQLDLLDALAARENALEQVTANANGWMATALSFVSGLYRPWEGTAEDLRLHIVALGCPAPHHHNAWGALVMTARRKGLLTETGRMANMRTKKSHARRTPVYQKSEGQNDDGRTFRGRAAIAAGNQANTRGERT